jgi:hypothetical protein
MITADRRSVYLAITQIRHPDSEDETCSNGSHSPRIRTAFQVERDLRRRTCTEILAGRKRPGAADFAV